MSLSFWFTEEQFNKISLLLPNKPRGVPRVDDCNVLSGIIFCIQRGYFWSDVPPEYGLAKTLYKPKSPSDESNVPLKNFLTQTSFESI